MDVIHFPFIGTNTEAYHVCGIAAPFFIYESVKVDVAFVAFVYLTYIYGQKLNDSQIKQLVS